MSKIYCKNLVLRLRLLLVPAFFTAAIAHADPATVTEPKEKGPSQTTEKAASRPDAKKKAIDRSGKPRRGKASYYHRKFAGRKMADGTPMNPEANIAASRTLPLGTKAEVTNLENGKTSVVEIRDRGPYVDGRIVDLSPKVARKLEIMEQGVAPVEVRPIELPPPGTNERKTATSQVSKSEQESE